MIAEEDVQLDNFYASLLNPTPSPCSLDDTIDDSYRDEVNADDVQYQPAAVTSQDKEIAEILNELAKVINNSCISKFDISRNFLWEGTKRALSFSPANKVSVKFTDDVGASEGAVDLGGPMRKFFTLIVPYIHDSQFFCGDENNKFLSFQSNCLYNDDYFQAGIILAMSIVHGGPGPQFFAPLMFDALVNDLSKVVIPLQCVYDEELRKSLQTLLRSATQQEAMQHMNEGHLPTILDLAGALAPLRVLNDDVEIVDTHRSMVCLTTSPASSG